MKSYCCGTYGWMDGSYALDCYDYWCICSAKNTLCIFPKVHWPNTENIARAKVRGSPAVSLPTSHRQLYFDATQGIYKILKIINFLHFRLPCAVCTLEHSRARNDIYSLRSVWYLMLMLSKHYVDPAKSPADKAAGAQWADHRGRILSIQGFAGSPSHWSVFFYLLSVCFLSTWRQSLSELLSIQGIAIYLPLINMFFIFYLSVFLSTSILVRIVVNARLC